MYRADRKREARRQAYLEEQDAKSKADAAFASRVAANTAKSEAATAKKRAKRLKAKQRKQEAKRKHEDEEEEGPHKSALLLPAPTLVFRRGCEHVFACKGRCSRASSRLRRGQGERTANGGGYLGPQLSSVRARHSAELSAP